MHIRNNPELVAYVLSRMENGEVITAICQEIGCTPSALSHYAEDDAQFAQRYARARLRQAAAMAADVVRIADEEPDPAKARVRCDARKWVAARIDPANYGDTQRLEHTGTVEHVVEHRLSEASDLLGKLLPPTIDHNPVAMRQAEAVGLPDVDAAPRRRPGGHKRRRLINGLAS